VVLLYKIRKQEDEREETLILSNTRRYIVLCFPISTEFVILAINAKIIPRSRRNKSINGRQINSKITSALFFTHKTAKFAALLHRA